MRDSHEFAPTCVEKPLGPSYRLMKRTSSRGAMNWRDEDDEIGRRLRAERPQLSRLEVDRIKTTAMARAGRSAQQPAQRSRLLIALLTVGLLIAGTASTIAGNTPLLTDSGTGAAQSQYRPPKCNPHHEECQCPGGSDRRSRDKCLCPYGQTFAPGTNDCRCPDGKHPIDHRCVNHRARSWPSRGSQNGPARDRQTVRTSSGLRVAKPARPRGPTVGQRHGHKTSLAASQP